MNPRFFARAATVALLLFAASGSLLAQTGDGQQPVRTPPDTQDPNATIRIETTLVTIPVSVLDHDGKYVAHLTKGDFHLFEDNVEQEVTDFRSVEAPFHVVLLLDTSRSTNFKLEDIQKAALTFIEQLHADDRVMIVSFDSDIYIDAEFTSDREQLRRAIRQTHTGFATRLYDAVDLVITERLSQAQGRKAVVLFTDGVDTASKLATMQSTLGRVEESGVLVYPLQYDTEGMLAGPLGMGRGRLPPPIYRPMPFPRGGGRRRWLLDPAATQRGARHEDYVRAAQYLRELADRSGARLYHADSSGKLKKAFGQIAEELRQQYSLSYYPANAARDGAYRRIRVQVTPLNLPNLVVRARAGYRATGGEKHE
ncbi:MAG: VWA domain-containing protein [Acidobacteria bacterium]|nr:VWA domain-containing protein [Acidobacteriota bacterium]MBI3422270.1 VWA domain-containing protein [Acidobacteriota bacterium]